MKKTSANLAATYAWSIVGLGLALSLLAYLHLPLIQFDFQLFAIVLFTLLLGSQLTLELPGIKAQITLADAAIFLALLLYNPETAILLAGAEALVNSILLRLRKVNIKLRTIFFNFAVITCSTSASAALFKVVPNFFESNSGKFNNQASQLFLAITLMALGSTLVNATLCALLSVTRKSGTFREEWKEIAASSALSYIIGSSFAAVALKLIENYSWTAVVYLVVVVAIFYSVYKHHLLKVKRSLRQAEEAERARAEAESERAEAERERAEAERERAEIEAKRRVELEQHLEELNRHVAEQERTSEALRVSKERFRHAALHDSLTGLPNRQFFIEQLKFLLDSTRPEFKLNFSVFFIDLDRFKIVNDSLGHAYGDELLCLAGQRLESIVRNGDTVARLGGDEFALILMDVTEESDAKLYAEQIRDSLSDPFALSGSEVFVLASIGIACTAADYKQPEDILRDADIAMYYAKENNLGFSVFNRELRTKAVNNHKIETDLRYALERNQFCVYYQPIIALDTGELAGFEALMRWQHPERGLVFPGDFIPAAEDTGLIVPMTLWILKAACQQLSKWRWSSPVNRDLLVSINISGLHFAQSGLVEEVAAILKETGLEANRLKLEITESAVMANAELATRTLTELRELGVQLSIDDFGTGYSSLSYLHQFPIDTLKVDRSFISRMGKSGENAEIVRTIVTLANNLGMQTIAEGVETVDQLEQLRFLDCHYAQGYFFAKPLPQDEIEKLIVSKKNWLPIHLEPLEPKKASNILSLEPNQNSFTANTRVFMNDTESELTVN